jgi:hypothetical protein
VNTLLDKASVAKMFFEQIAEFCQMAQEAFMAKFDTMAEVPISGSAALAFADRLLLCPTADAARLCIRKDLIGALSFVMAVQGVQHRIQQNGNWPIFDAPDYQTRFYLLACAVRDYMYSLQAQAA